MMMKTSAPRLKILLRHVAIDAADESDYGNHRSHANDHTEQGQCRAQLIGPKRLQRNADGFGCVHETVVGRKLSPPEQRRDCLQV